MCGLDAILEQSFSFKSCQHCARQPFAVQQNASTSSNTGGQELKQ
jgi:hypothetical protein